jgi:hypothetical protein
LRFVDLDGAPIEHGAVELRDRAVCGLVVAHRNEGKPARLPGLTIRWHGYFANFAGDGKGCLDRGLRGAEREISDVETIAHDAFVWLLLCVLSSTLRLPFAEAVRAERRRTETQETPTMGKFVRRGARCVIQSSKRASFFGRGATCQAGGDDSVYSATLAHPSVLDKHARKETCLPCSNA